MSAWTKRLLRVNLTAGTTSVETIRDDWLREYVGGRGLAARYLYEEMDPTVDPLSPDNKLIFATGPLTGTPVPCGARYMVVTKGALTNAITTSNSGGHWGPELKFAGYDLLILEGKAPKPSYLFIYDDQVEIRDASERRYRERLSNNRNAIIARHRARAAVTRRDIRAKCFTLYSAGRGACLPG